MDALGDLYKKCGIGRQGLEKKEGVEDPQETIVAAALRFTDGEVWSVPPPVRHCHLIWIWCVAHWKDGKPEPHVAAHAQGFITSTGRFVEREEAAKIAHQQGQISTPKMALFSEDLW